MYQMKGRCFRTSPLNLGSEAGPGFLVAAQGLYSLKLKPRGTIRLESIQIIWFMQLNSLAMSWVDFRELVAAQDVDILDDKEEAASEALLMAMDQHRSGKSPLGASWRWMVAVADNGLSLELLPAGAALQPGQPSREPSIEAGQSGHGGARQIWPTSLQLKWEGKRDTHPHHVLFQSGGS
jgi:hypothetical protein